jgi:hypothetical protein
MKKVSLMVAAALLSASMFATVASLPKKSTTVNGKTPKTEISKMHKKTKPKAVAIKHKTSTKKTNTKPVAKK